MKTLQELIKEKTGKDVVASGNSPREKVLLQALSMATKLDVMRKVDELDYKGSQPKWWAGTSAGDKRKVSAFYSNKKFAGTECWVDNNIKAITAHIVELAEVFKEADESVFEAEEKRRAEAAEKNSRKKN